MSVLPVIIACHANAQRTSAAPKVTVVIPPFAHKARNLKGHGIDPIEASKMAMGRSLSDDADIRATLDAAVEMILDEMPELARRLAAAAFLSRMGLRV